MILGPDVSAWQGEIDWAAVAASGRRFAFVKATEGTSYVAETFAAHRQGARAAGLSLVGLYHFARPEKDSAGAEASHFLATVGQLAIGEVAVLDIETGDQAGWEGWAGEWLRTVEEATGRRPIVYMSLDPADRYGFESLVRFPLWVAAYGSNNGQLPAWGTNWRAGAWPQWTFWQYSSNVSVPGVSGVCDDNAFAGTDSELAALGGVEEGPETGRLVTYGWEEIHSYLHSLGIAAADPSVGQSTGGTHATRSEHYPSSHPAYPDGVRRGHAVDYGRYDGLSDLAAIVAALEPLAQGADPVIVELFWPDGGWSHGVWTGEIDVPNHLHAAIAYERHLPVAHPPEEPMAAACPHILLTYGSGVVLWHTSGNLLTLASEKQVKDFLAAGAVVMDDLTGDQLADLALGDLKGVAEPVPLAHLLRPGLHAGANTTPAR